MVQRPREVTIPAAAFDHLRTALAEHSAEGAGVSALHAAGFASGEALYEVFAETGGGSPERLGRTRFWQRLAGFLSDRGWGTLEHATPHPGVSVLRSRDWAEAETTDDAHSTCAFTSGLLSAMLSRTAGAPVAVLETTCRGRGDAHCEFAFGSEQTIQSLYAELVAGGSLDDALARL